VIFREYVFSGTDDEWMQFFKDNVPRTGWREVADFRTANNTVRVLNFEREFDGFAAELIVTSDTREVSADVKKPSFCDGNSH
jgi:hypothetical protein